MPPSENFSNRPQRSELASAFLSCRSAFIGIGIFSAVVNVLMLTGSFFMLEIYDRVLPSRHVPTLVGLIFIAGTLFCFQGLIDLLRSRILVRIGASLDESLSKRIYDAVVHLPLKTARNDSLQSLRDLDSIRSFLSGAGPLALFDLPWIPFYLGICFAFHFWLGMTALLGAIILVAMTLLTEIMLRGPTKSTNRFMTSRNALAETSRRNAEVLVAMGMTNRLQERWLDLNQKYIASQQQTSDVAGGLGAIVKVLRMMLQSSVLAVGAYLVLQQEATAGIIIAGSILSARALAPVDLAIANWRGFVAARQSWERLSKLFILIPVLEEPMKLPAPKTTVSAENISLAPPGSQKVVLHDVNFALKSGSGLGVIGPSGSGKSCLARVLAGVWPATRGKVTLDAAAIDQWASTTRGQHIGYLPQDVELISGTVAQNISRFLRTPDPSEIVSAASAAGVHELIVSLPAGYETQIGEQGGILSAGQQQRIALARALFGNPFLVVLDEPNSNLDAEGELALTQAILNVRARGGVVIVIAHRPSALAGVDFVLAMRNGQAQAFGPKDEVLNKVLRRPVPSQVLPVNIAAEGGRNS